MIQNLMLSLDLLVKNKDTNSDKMTIQKVYYVLKCI